MHFSNAVIVLASLCSSTVFTKAPVPARVVSRNAELLNARAVTYYSGPCITPKVFIISLFSPEAAVWLGDHFGLLAQNISIPGLSPLYPSIHCDEAGDVCQITTGESEINAASTISALVLSSSFSLSTTYFLVAGIAGINPACGTLGAVALARYTVQIGLEYQIATSELSANYSSRAGYIPLGATTPDGYPVYIYGTEVFELNANLRNRALKLARTANLTDSATAQAYRSKYPSAPANQPPTVFKGDTETSDVYWHGAVLGDAFSTYFSLLTNGSGKYCMTAQEDNAVLEAMIRAAAAKRVDFTRIMVMRTASNFDRPPPGETAYQSLFDDVSGGFPISLANIYEAGRPIVDDILGKWKGVYEGGVKVKNYAGDVFDSVPDGFVPDIGSPSSQQG